MTRVLIRVPNSPMWIGGLNYFINLAKGLIAGGSGEIELVILGSASQLPAPLNGCRELYWQDEDWDSLSRYHPRKILKKIARKVTGRKREQEFIELLTEHDIALFSHGFPLGKDSPIPSLCWIPDFQHRRLPQYFSRQEIEGRDKYQSDYGEMAHAMLFSSISSLSDFKEFHPHNDTPCHVLRFVAAPRPLDESAAPAVLDRYGIKEHYFHLPNQLWKHKNHRVVIAALRILEERRKSPLVISTGFKEDYRFPSYPRELLEEVAAAGLQERFRFLGLIGQEEMGHIMRNAVALINPSYFEGWSTTVEEGKSMGKAILLSDIDVHREQAPLRGEYFHPDDPEALAELMMRTMGAFDPARERDYFDQAAKELPGRITVFAQTYERIVKSVLDGRGK